MKTEKSTKRKKTKRARRRAAPSRLTRARSRSPASGRGATNKAAGKVAGKGGGKAESAKVALILRAAAKEFMELGYGATNMDDIAQTAGVSKATVYAHFASKEALFGVMVSEECRKHLLAGGERGKGAVTADDPRAGLIYLGTRFIEFILRPRALAVYRVVVDAAPRFPELGKAFYRAGPATLERSLAAYIEAVCAAGSLAVEDSGRAAAHFLGMLRGNLQLRCLMMPGEKISKRRICQHVTSAVDLFLKAYAPDMPGKETPQKEAVGKRG